MAIQELAYNTEQVLGIDTASLCDDLDVAKMIIAHADGVRRLPGFAQSLCVLIFESNMMGPALGTLRSLNQLGKRNMVIMREDIEPTFGEELRPGSRTMEKNKIQQVFMLKGLLESERMMIHEDYVMAAPDYSAYPDPSLELVRQLRSFMQNRKENNRDPTAPPRISYDGKNGGRSKDDMVMSLANNIYNASVFEQSDRYIQYRARCNANAL